MTTYAPGRHCIERVPSSTVHVARQQKSICVTSAGLGGIKARQCAECTAMLKMHSGTDQLYPPAYPVTRRHSARPTTRTLSRGVKRLRVALITPSVKRVRLL